ncbi:hypothetical protein [Megalodesulfovibrio gigas]|uniref:Uncharacterized protein n=1 Tax=Megalodesulfovibrio gigas (strain ATCC 19364 / DSM 1382 / NCIMB 9332 / VKM B-1759) TaxID=1121448 RepID=T2G9R1_MEGG1|nr:hypothetical protein [Megalodesulfovibrio gigas]AGW12866.1 hypothetical protein DGI_0987 [Megalodesulfovibrio gigas DSM 1382 = ATCC 19364]
MAFSESLPFKGETVEYDPDRNVALVHCERCSHPNEVECFKARDGSVEVPGFSCENCGHWNAPE